MPDTLKPCPFCGVNLMFMRGKRVNRYYNGEPTVYQHPQKDNCILGKYGKEVQVWKDDIDAWNRRVGHEPAGECAKHNRAERGSWCGEEGEKG